MFSNLASIVHQFSENEVTLESTFRETKAESNENMIEIAKDLAEQGGKQDHEVFDSTPFMNDLKRVQRDIQDAKTSHIKDRQTLKSECYEELMEAMSLARTIPRSTSKVIGSATHKAYLPCHASTHAYEIEFSRNGSVRFTGIIPLLKVDGTSHPVPRRPEWWNADGTPLVPGDFPIMVSIATAHQHDAPPDRRANLKATQTNLAAQRPADAQRREAQQKHYWDTWCKLNNPFSDQ